MLHGGIGPASLALDAVARTDLVGVLAVAKHIGAAKLELHPLGQNLVDLVGSFAVGPHPIGNGKIISRRMSKRFGCQPATGLMEKLAMFAKLFEHRQIVGRINQDTDGVEVLRRSADHGRSTNVDQFDTRT